MCHKLFIGKTKAKDIVNCLCQKNGNVCLGILDGSVAKLNFNIIGGTKSRLTQPGLWNDHTLHLCVIVRFDLLFVDITMQDQLVIYDNEKGKLGWIRGSCSRGTKYIISSFTWYLLIIQLLAHPLKSWIYHYWWNWPTGGSYYWLENPEILTLSELKRVQAIAIHRIGNRRIKITVTWLGKLDDVSGEGWPCHITLAERNILTSMLLLFVIRWNLYFTSLAWIVLYFSLS